MGRNKGKPESPVSAELGQKIARYILENMDEYEFMPASGHNIKVSSELNIKPVQIASVKSAMTMLGLLEAHGERGGKAYKLSPLGKQVRGLMDV